MKTYTFPFIISFGKLDSVDGQIDYALSDKNAKRLERSAKEGGRLRLDEDEDIQDIFDSVYYAIIDLEKKQLIADPSVVQDALNWENDQYQEATISEEHIDSYLDDLIIGINYPESLQMLDRQVRKKVSQSKFESVDVEREHVQEFLMVPGNVERIVYIDGGKTLFHVPKKYSGVFVVPSRVNTIEKRTFRDHTKITEIVIEDGIQELPEWVFDSCASLRKVTIPSSVKKIGFNAFTHCKSLQEVVLSNGLIEIDSTAFRACFNLKKLSIPASVEKISAFMCSYNNGIKEIHFLGMKTEIDDSRGGDLSRQVLFVKTGSKAEEFAKKHSIRYIIEK